MCHKGYKMAQKPCTTGHHGIVDVGLLMLDSVSNLTTQYNTKLTVLAYKTITECPGAE